MVIDMDSWNVMEMKVTQSKIQDLHEWESGYIQMIVKSLGMMGWSWGRGIVNPKCKEYNRKFIREHQIEIEGNMKWNYKSLK